MTPEQAEEVEALVSIFGTDAVNYADDGCSMEMPYGESGTAKMSIHIPARYPAEPPTVTISGLPRGQTEALLTHLAVLSSSMAGQPHLFELVNAVRGWLGLDDVPEPEPLVVVSGSHDAQDGGENADGTPQRQHGLSASDIPIVHGEPGCGVVIDRKSVFQAHVAPIRNRDEVAEVLATLYSEPKIARATHNIQAWRFWHEGTGSWTCEGDDDGEDGAARKLELMLQHMDIRNCVVVVTRWFGGVLLGPVRFHHINTAAKQMLEREGYANGGAGKGSGPSASGPQQHGHGGKR